MSNYLNCGCKNCRHVNKQKMIMLKSVRPAGKGISQDMVDLYNFALNNFPCLTPDINLGCLPLTQAKGAQDVQA